MLGSWFGELLLDCSGGGIEHHRSAVFVTFLLDAKEAAVRGGGYEVQDLWRQG